MTVKSSIPPRNRERQRTLRAVIASVCIHLVIIVLAALFLALQPADPSEEDSEPIELTLVPPPISQPTPIQAMVATTESQRSPEAPENPDFESDKDTQAAAEQSAEGELPLPSQAGLENPALEFENQEYSAGAEARPSSPASPTQPAAPEETIPPRPSTQLALLDPPKPKATQKPKPEKAQPQPDTPPSPQTAQPPGYQPQTRVTRIRGNISNRGRSAVSAAATPLGRYKKMLSDAIGSRWYFAVNRQMGLLTPGTVELAFVVSAEGKTQKIQVLRNSSNESFAACSVGAVMEAEIPPIPRELIPMLENGRIEIEFSFTILSN